MSPHLLLLLLLALSDVSFTETTTAPRPLVSSETSIKSATTSNSIDAALISQQLINLTLLDWHNNEDFQSLIGEKGQNATEEMEQMPVYKPVFLLEAALTLFIMGLTEEYTKVRNWVATKFPNTSADINFLNDEYRAYRLVSNLIGLHGLTEDAVYLEKAQVMLTMFGKSSKPHWTRAWTILYPEYHYLSEVTGNADWAQWAVKFGEEEVAQNQFKEDFSYSTEYLLAKAKHAYLDPTRDRIDHLRRQIDTIFANPSTWRLKQINDTSLWYFGSREYSSHAGLLTYQEARRVVAFALAGAIIMKSCSGSGATSCPSLDASDRWTVARTVRALEDSSVMWQRALELLDSYWILTESRVPIKVVPYKLEIERTKKQLIAFYPMMPEIYFYLWRLTGRQQYRKMAWWMAQAMIKYSWNEAAKQFQLVDENGKAADVAYVWADLSYLTLRYLYLTFQPTDQYPLNRWTTSEWGHFLPICNGKLKRC